MSTINELEAPRERCGPIICSSGFGERSPSVRVASTADDFAAATALVIEHLAWIERESGIPVFAAQPALVGELADLRASYSIAPSAVFVADDGAAVCGALAVRFHDDGSAELKRMFVRPDARGRGHAGRLLRTALDHVDRFDARRVWLESVPGLMDPAIELYRRHGFEIEAGPALVDVDHAIVMTLHSAGGRP